MPNIFNEFASGGIAISANSTVVLQNMTGGYLCLDDNKFVLSKGDFVYPDQHKTVIRSGMRNAGGIRNAAYVAAITICKYKLKDKIISQKQKKVYSQGFIQNTRHIFANGGSISGGESLNNYFGYIESNGGVFASGESVDQFVPYTFDPVFDGTFYLEHQSPNNLPYGNDARSMFAWVRVPEYTTAQSMFGYGGSEDSTILEFLYSNSKVGLFINSSYENFTLEPNTWYLVGFSSDSMSGMHYVCGNSINSVPFYPEWAGTTLGNIRAGLGIGPEGLTNPENLFIGDIVGIGIWDRQLSGDEVLALYNAGRTTYSDLPLELKTTHITSTSNAQTKTINVSDLQSRSISIESLDARITSSHQAASFDGTNRILIDNAPTNVNTISLWVNIFDNDSLGAIITKGNTDWNSGVWDWGIWHDAGNTFYVCAEAGGPFVGYNYNDSSWYHLVIIRNNGNGNSEFYVNGALIGTGIASSSNSYENKILIGGNVNNIVGKIQEVQLFDIALSPSEISSIYNLGFVIQGSNTDNGLIAGYHLDGDLTDYSANGNTGTWDLGIESYDVGADQSEVIFTNNDMEIEVCNATVENIFTSGDFNLEVSKSTIEDLLTSDGEILEFGNLETVDSGLVGFWNMTETDGVRYDSVGDNHLNYMVQQAEFSYTEVVGRGNPVYFTDESILATSWLWDFGDETTSTQQNPTHTYNSVGTFAVTLTINGSISTNHQIVVEEPVASFSSDSPKNIGDTIYFSDQSTHAISWFWDFGDGNTSTQQNPSHVYETSGEYNVYLEINGNISNTSIVVTINSITSYIWDKVDISSYYNMIGFVSPGFNYTSLPNYGLDGYGAGSTWGTGGYCMNSAALGSTPQSFVGVEFDVPQAGEFNDVFNIIRCTGQTIPLHGGQYTELRLLAFITNAPSRTVNFVVTYSDSSTDTINQSISDWFYGYGNHFTNETVVKSMSTRIAPNGNQSSASVFMYQYVIPVDSTKNAVSITLPSTEFTYVCSITQATQIAQPACWIKADSLPTLTDGDLVDTLNDRSGNSRDFSTSGSYRPSYRTDIINGKPALLFEASNYMQSLIPVPNKYSVFAVYKQNVTGNFSIAVSWGSGSGGNTFWSGYISGMSYSGHLVPASDSHFDNYSESSNDTMWHLIEGKFDGTNLTGKDFGVNATPSVVQQSGTLSSSTATIGGYGESPTFLWNGYIAEVLFFNTQLSSQHVDLIYSYLTYKYSLVDQNEIQRISFDIIPTSGTYTITANGQTTDNIPFDTDAVNIQSYINTSFGENVVVVN